MKKARFYKVVEKVYVHKLKNEELNEYNYNDVFLAVTDVMADFNQPDNGNTSAKWDEELRKEHALVIQDFKSGKLQWKDVDMGEIRDIGKKIVRDIENEVNEVYKKLKAKLKVGDLSKIGNKVERISDKIFRSIGGGGRL